MTGSRPNAYWLFCWKFVSPLAMTGILVASVIDMIVRGAGYEVQIGFEEYSVQLNLTPEIKVFYILFVRSLSFFRMTSLKQHME